MTLASQNGCDSFHCDFSVHSSGEAGKDGSFSCCCIKHSQKTYQLL